MRNLYLFTIVFLVITGCTGMNIKKSIRQVDEVLNGKIVVAKVVPGLEKEWINNNTRWGSYRQLYVMDTNGNNCYPLPDTFFKERMIGNPKWSPDGEKIIFLVCSIERFGSLSVYIISKSGSDCKKIYTGQCDYLSFYPDGKRIIFVEGMEGNEIWSMKIDGSDVNPLATNIRKEGNIIKNISYPSVSPDGKQILFVGSTGTGTEIDMFGIFTIAIDTFEVTEIISSKVVKIDEWEPCWSPNGRKIVFANQEGVYVIDVDGTNLTRIISPKERLGAYNTPYWSSDGKRIMYNYYYSTDWPFSLWQNREELHIMNADGTNDKLIVTFKDMDLRIGNDFDWWTPKKEE